MCFLRHRREPTRASSCLVLILLFLFPLRSAADTEYLVRSWDFETNVSIRGLNCLCIGRDGFLWLGTKDGLVRFDGVQFIRQVFPDSTLIQGNNVTALWEGGENTLWLGCESGELYRWDRSTASLALQPQRWPAQAIRAIAGDGYGDVWIALASHDLVRIEDGWTLHAPPSARITGTVQHLLLTNDGRLYQQDNTIVRLQAGTRKAPVWQELAVPDTRIEGLAPSQFQGLWVYDQDRIRLWAGSHWTFDRGRLPEGTKINRMLEASSGDLFVGTLNHGLLVCRADGTTQSLTDSVAGASERIVDIAEDHEGNLLVCSDRRLSRIRASRVQVVPLPDNWSGGQLVSIAVAPDGTRWLGTEGSGLFRLRPGEIEHFGENAGLSKPYIWSLLPDGDDLWVGTWGAGLFHGSHGRFTPVAGWEMEKGWSVPALFRDHAGAVWAGTNTGLWRQQGDGWTAIKESDGSPLTLVRGIAEGPAGRIWLATNGHGLKVWENGRVRDAGPGDGMTARFVSSLHWTELGQLWMGTLGSGLYRWDGKRWAHLNHEHGLPSDDIFHIAVDPQGKFWFTSPVGAFTIAGHELGECADGTRAQVHPLIIDRDDGLPSNHCSSGTQSAAFLAPNGEFVIPTSLGLAIVRTEQIVPRTKRVPVAITTVSVDDRLETLGAGGSVQAPAGTRRLAIEFTAPSFTSPERIRFRYQLRGLDDRWVDLGTRRSVLFTRLPPGSYQLHLMAANADGVWNPVPATLALELAPHFWETGWFRSGVLALIVAFAGLVAWYLAHRRARQRLQRLESQQAIEHERRRIARDIHDELGASLTQIMMLSQVGTPTVDGRNAETAVLSRIHAVACGITTAMDELVWAINPTHDTIESFAAYSARTAQELVNAAGLRVRLNLPRQFPDISLNAGTRHHLLLILKEALNNALRHAQAREITLTLALEEGRLLLEVSDDGLGLGTTTSGINASRVSGGHGLPNLRQRTDALGGTFTIGPAAGRGTTLRILVPISAARHDGHPPIL